MRESEIAGKHQGSYTENAGDGKSRYEKNFYKYQDYTQYD
jgi:hypothetical protein